MSPKIRDHENDNRQDEQTTQIPDDRQEELPIKRGFSIEPEKGWSRPKKPNK